MEGEQNMRRFLSGFVLSAALMAPVVMTARAEERRIVVKRYYDRDNRDWHEWNENEDRAYRHYLMEQRREYRPWPEVRRREEQREYWRWRHQHPDSVIIERR
jgi:type III secretory pathway component EscR